MPSMEHEMPIEFLHNRPELAAALLERSFGVAVPDYDEARMAAADCTDNQPKEYRPDGVVVLRNAGLDRLAVVVEIQRAQDKRKRFSWPVYLATIRARLRCPAVLLVVCHDAATAKWAGEPIDMGHPNWHLLPLVLGEDRVPVVTSVADAVALPELAVLSALAHGDEEKETLLACAEALDSLPGDVFKLYHGYLKTALTGAARRNWDEMVKTSEKFENDFGRKYEELGEAKGLAKGLAEGKAESVLRILAKRGVAVSARARERIASCSDLDQLDAWLDRALVADSADDLFT
ncbi:hypothetical protein FZ103_05395 [Streptomonospora sp. PA3]|uniref:hypothetical protein n=1 Tax=Streptomonospora sp. PA3 TaxID=2607326 RepID=UPI0012DEF1C8|nr:hypothetical protein [Streptomonospora sp. PA3]MUL40619.1 hypothetical protein [Streptomonospora sp. PA3]